MSYEGNDILTGTPHETIPTKVLVSGLLMSTNGPPVYLIIIIKIFLLKFIALAVYKI